MMNAQKQTDFDRITDAINYIADNFNSQPGLDQVAQKVNLSPAHFQRLFTQWAGTSPKKFLQYISIEHAKKLLQDEQLSVLQAALETGLSSPSRLYDLFVNIEGMTPGEYKNGGANLAINYSFAESPFGDILIASTSKGIAYMAFADDETNAFAELKSKFPNATYTSKLDLIQQNALQIFTRDWNEPGEIKLHLKGTDFQLKVWKALLNIPPGRLSTYGNIAKRIALPQASRAVGTAVGQNPVAFLIPCHRVIRSTGVFGNYHWGSARKTAMIGWEAAKASDE
jgi:AraC family transcriptional regulator of adaptative response/methylated-DNA-[protein]-cysteine methyltransferase